MENVVILCWEDEFVWFGKFLLFDGIYENLFLCYGYNIVVEVVDLGFEEVVYFVNG